MSMVNNLNLKVQKLIPKKKSSLFYLGVLILLIILIVLIFFSFNAVFPQYSYKGTIFDVYGNPVEGVNVTGLHGESAITNELGFFSLNSGFIGKSTINFKKNGFVPLHKTIEFGNDLFLDLLLFPAEEFESVDVSEDINVEMRRAGLNLEKNSLVLKGTNIPATSANVSLTPFDPTDEEEIQAFPGEFEGIQQNGETVDIESFGFEKVMVRDDEENPLDLAEGKTAELIIPIPTSERDYAPESIPLWNFDEKLGTWVEKGSATKYCNENGCYYKGNITTIASWWNGDKGFFSKLMGLASKIGGALMNALANALGAIKGWLNSAGSAIGNILSGMKAGLQSAYGAAKDFLKSRAQGLVDNAKKLINSGEYSGKFKLTENADGSIDLTYTGELNTLADLANCARDLESLFPDATPAEITRMMRNSTNYGKWGASNLAKFLPHLFSGGELQDLVRLRSSDGGLFLGKNGGELNCNGVPFDAVHTLIGMDSVGNIIPAAFAEVSPFFDVSRYQDIIDVRDAWIANDLGKMNPADLRGNHLAPAANPLRAGSTSAALNNAANNFDSITANDNIYENTIYNPVHNGVPVSGIPIRSVLTDASLSAYNVVKIVISGMNFSESNNSIKYSRLYFSENDDALENDIDDFGVNIKTGEINVNVWFGLINYSQFQKLDLTSSVYPFSISDVNDKRFLYPNGKLEYIADLNNYGIFFNYENNYLRNIFFVSDDNYYMKYDLNYTTGLFSSINLSFADSNINLSDIKQMEYDSLGRLNKLNYNGVIRIIQYDDLNRVVFQKFLNSLDQVVYSVSYDYQATKTVVFEYYKDKEILLGTIIYDYSQGEVKISSQENISYFDLENFTKLDLSEEEQSNIFTEAQDLILQTWLTSNGYSLKLNKYISLTGVDYAYYKKRLVSFNSYDFGDTLEGMMKSFDKSIRGLKMYAKKGGTVEVKLEVDGFISQGKKVKVDEIDDPQVDLTYSLIVVPVGLNNFDNAANISVKYTTDEGVVLSAKKLISKNRPYDFFGFLVLPNQLGKIIIEEKWSGYRSEINIDGLEMNDVKIMDKIMFDGNNFSSLGVAQRIFNCQDFKGDKQKNCYRDEIISEAKSKKEVMGCFDVFDYNASYTYAVNCVRAVDTKKTLSYDSIMNKLLEKDMVNVNGFLYYDFMSYYKNENFCQHIVEDYKKKMCYNYYASKYKAK